VTLLSRLVPSEITTLSICDLATGRRRVVSHPQHAFSADALGAFDRHFFTHPLVKFHATHHDGGVHRITDSVSERAFRGTSLFADYYLKVGLTHSLALPLYVDGDLLVSFVLNRQGRDFADRERDLLDCLRPQLASLFRASVTLARLRLAHAAAESPRDVVIPASLAQDRLQALTAREREVLGWVTAGKTNAQIGAILCISPRTVAKHLERVYQSLGVESRTAAAMRATSARRGANSR
jgi:DNA-binding CsgD family transcriptional regulator